MATTKIKYDAELMKLMAFFESATGAKLKDCFVDSQGLLTFVVESGIGLAIGKGGSTFRKLEAELRRKIRIFAFAAPVEEFVQNLVQPLKIRSAVQEDRKLIVTPEPESRGYLIGRAASNLRNYESIVKRYFDIDEMRVV